MRLAAIIDKGRRIAVYDGRKRLATFIVEDQLDASIVEEARTWGAAPPVAEQHTHTKAPE